MMQKSFNILGNDGGQGVARLLALLILMLAASNSADALRYEVRELAGSPAYTYLSPTSISESGWIAGSITGSGHERAFAWNNGTVWDLGTTDERSSRATDANNKGQVVGWCDTSTSTRPFLWENGSFRDLGPISTNPNASAHGINDSGQIVGWERDAQGRNFPFLWKNGVACPLASFEMTSGSASSISENGYVVGTATNYPFLWKDGAQIDTGSLASTWGFASDVNDQAQIAGSYRTPKTDNRWHGFIWEDGAMRDLGLLPGCSETYAFGINGIGQVVGYSVTSSQSLKAFIWQDNAMYDLSTLIPSDQGWILRSAAAINDLGQIVGVGTHNGKSAGFVLTPVPEPSCLLALIFGISAVAWRRRR